MKKLFSQLVIIGIILTSISIIQLKGQQKESNPTSKDKIEVNLASYFFETDEKTIEIIEKKEHITCHEYIDLALVYANLFADTSKIDSLIVQSISANPNIACDFWMYLLKDPKKHQITFQYFNTVKSNTNGCKDE